MKNSLIEMCSEHEKRKAVLPIRGVFEVRKTDLLPDEANDDQFRLRETFCFASL